MISRSPFNTHGAAIMAGVTLAQASTLRAEVFCSCVDDVSCRKREPAAVDCAPAVSIASSVADNVSRTPPLDAANVSRKALQLRARAASIVSHYS
jgi:hypothetical protein